MCVEAAAESPVRVPRKTDYVIMDAPAGIHGQPLINLVRRAETLIMPVLPSPIDIRAAHRFTEELFHLGRVVRKQVRLATVINRARENSTARVLLENAARNSASFTRNSGGRNVTNRGSAPHMARHAR